MKFAVIFPGQGSQSLAMLSDTAQNFSEVQNTFSEASSVLGYDLWNLVQNGPAEKLNQTEFTQPALLTASVALWRVWGALGGQLPRYLAGHSLGEYSALVCAGSLAFSDAVRLVATRGAAMQAAVPAGQGAMAAIIGLSDEQVAALCHEHAEQQVLTPANYNAPGQVVIAGHAQAVERALPAAKAAGAKLAKLLPVSVPSHCLLMQPAVEEMQSVLTNIDFATPQIEVINNVDVAIETSPAAIKDALVRQLHSPVQWTQTMQWLADQGIGTVLECGPNKVLTSLGKRIAKSVNWLPMQEPAQIQAALDSVSIEQA